MTHMHIPDGILPVWLWVAGFLVMAAVLALCLHRLRGMDMKKKIPLLGVLSAVMLVAMNIPELIPPYHLNLSVATGILLGPSLGFVAAFLVNLILAFLGHGGISVMGLNTLLLGVEAMLGHTLFYLIGKRLPIFWRTALATVLSLAFAAVCLIGIVGISHADIDLLVHRDGQADVHGHGGGEASISTFAIMVLSLGSIGWIIEAAITGVAIRFLSRVKPDLLAHTLHKDTCPGRSGECAP